MPAAFELFVAVIGVADILLHSGTTPSARSDSLPSVSKRKWRVDDTYSFSAACICMGSYRFIRYFDTPWQRSGFTHPPVVKPVHMGKSSYCGMPFRIYKLWYSVAALRKPQVRSQKILHCSATIPSKYQYNVSTSECTYTSPSFRRFAEAYFLLWLPDRILSELWLLTPA